ncbi:carboxymuconolactone decarboxylase family protein [Sporomusa malonica]|uniref:Alkylhydroperoxidase AhpD family core domain-containing protein n=1 Tax=Sporomusa malonica TaxID=112901 RepID=A0A1W1YF80_9FIRM|nr:carboxymuconolactone decarboxylase family protein [Sporomusa malonica]SMC34870.1 alkylhydroperoxidase AhpD family core domain-containing protein [Sporomusa malonica]
MVFDEKLTELIAIGASIGANCQPCLDYHVNKAKDHGASEQEISAAINIGKTVRKGAAFKMDEHAAALQGKPSANPGSTGNVCDCSGGSCC